MSEEKSETRKAMDEWVSKMSDEEALENYKRVKFDEFKMKNIDKLKMWFDAHGSFAPPIRWDGKILDYIWLNRKERREAERERKSNNRKRAKSSDRGEREAYQEDPGAGSQDQSP